MLSRLTDTVSFVYGENKGRFPSSHGLLLTGRQTALIDAGVGQDRIRALDEERRIDVLIITHSHPDHIRYWHVLKDRTILMPAETPDSITDLRDLGARFTGKPEDAAVWADLVGNTFGVRPMRLPDERFEDGGIIDLGGVELEAIAARGHTDDHYCFFDRISGTLFSTDIDFSSFGPWYGNPESDIITFRRSVERIMKRSYERVCTSHKPPIEGDATAEFEAFLAAFDRQKETVLNLCRQGVGLNRMLEISPFFRNGLPDKVVQGVFERAMIVKNMDLLVNEGAITESEYSGALEA